MTFLQGPSVQSPKAYDTKNFNRAGLRTRLTDDAYRYKIHPRETAVGLVDGNLTWARPGDVRRYGVVDDDTDQTAAILAALALLTSAWDLPLYISERIRFDTQAVIDALPERAPMRFTNVFQSGSGYRQQLTGYMSRPPDANTDTAFTVVDPHYADIQINNPRTAGTTSAASGLSGFSWCRGFFTRGTKGPRPLLQSNYTRANVREAEYSGKGVWCYITRARSPERAGDYEFWETGVTWTVGQFVHASNGWVYRCTVSPGASTIEPTHDTGTVVGADSVGWAFRSKWTPFNTVFYYDELGRIGTAPCDSGVTHEWLQNPEDAEDFHVRWTARGNSKTIKFRPLPSKTDGTTYGVPYWQFSEAIGGGRLITSDDGLVLARATDARGFELGVSGRIPATAADGDTTPSINACARLILANTGATNVTGFDDFLPGQEVELYFSTANTTLVHSSTLFLKGATNVSCNNASIIVITRDPTNSAWIEKSRNF